MKKKGTKRGLAVHTYVDNHIGKKRGPSNLNEIYGGMTAAAFNYMFSNPDYLGYLSYQTQNEFMKAWCVARGASQKALAFGLASHNDVWGADSTAHHSGRTFGQEEGYVIAKAQALTPSILEQLNALVSELPDPPPPEVLDAIAIEVSRELVENAVDILLKRMDHSIGRTITFTALLRSPEIKGKALYIYWAQDKSRIGTELK